MSGGFVRRFLFEGLDIRGAIVHLDEAWRQMQANRGYPPPVARLLGEMAAVTALIAGQLKQAGRLTFQLRGEGAIKLLVIDCDEQLRMRGMARAEGVVDERPVPELLGIEQGGQLLLSLDLPLAHQPYQSVVPMVGDSVAAIFEHYLEQSEQQAAHLALAADESAAACLFLQKLPDADQRDADGWNRLTQLAASVKAEELLGLDTEVLLQRLFHEEIAAGGLRLYDPRPVVYHCPEDRDKVAQMLRALGRDELQPLLDEFGEVVIQDEICNRNYRFSRADIDALFVGPVDDAGTASPPPTLH
jgi:molecular chaperone Hsp33